MTVGIGSEVEAPTWQGWEAHASTDPQPESELLIKNDSFTLERYSAWSGDYLVAWVQHGCVMFRMHLLIGDVEWYGQGKAIFLGARPDDAGQATEMVWFAAR